MVGKAIVLSLALFTLAAHATNEVNIHHGSRGMRAYEHRPLPERTLGSDALRWEERQQTMERILRFEQELQYEHSITRRCQETFPDSARILLQCIRRLAARS